MGKIKTLLPRPRLALTFLTQWVSALLAFFLSLSQDKSGSLLRNFVLSLSPVWNAQSLNFLMAHLFSFLMSHCTCHMLVILYLALIEKTTVITFRYQKFGIGF